MQHKNCCHPEICSIKIAVILSERGLRRTLQPGSTIFAVILSERGPRRTLQPGGGESKDLWLFFNELLTHHTSLTRPARPLQLAEKCQRSSKKCQGTAFTACGKMPTE